MVGARNESVSEETAKATAIDLASARYPVFGGDRLAIDPARTEERELGWMFYVQSQRFLETRSPAAELLDVTPVFVRRHSGLATWVKRYGPTDFEVDGRPRPDWPPRAFVAVPAAIVVQAATWIAMWWAWYALARAIGFVPVHFIALVVGMSMAVLPADFVIRWARFRNFDRWSGLGVALVGIALAKLVSARFAVLPAFELELERFGYSIEIPMELVELFAALIIATGGTFIGQRKKSTRAAWEASRVIAAPRGRDDED